MGMKQNSGLGRNAEILVVLDQRSSQSAFHCCDSQGKDRTRSRSARRTFSRGSEINCDASFDNVRDKLFLVVRDQGGII